MLIISDNFTTLTYNCVCNFSKAEVKVSLSRGSARDEKLQQTMNLTLKRLNTYQQVSVARGNTSRSCINCRCFAAPNPGRLPAGSLCRDTLYEH